MFILCADKTKLTVRQREPVTSGSVNVSQARFEFSEDWAGLTRIAVFRAGQRSVSVLLDASNACVIPWEVLEKPEMKLFCGVYGMLGNETVLPTIWADLGWIAAGVRPIWNAWPPTPELWEQALASKGDTLGYTDEGDLGLYAGDKLLSAVPVQNGGAASFGVGHGLKVVNGDLTVDTVDDFNGDNTLPMTAAGVQAVVQAAIGDIEVLLGTI